MGDKNLLEILDKVVTENGEKGLTINCKETESMVANQRNSLRYDLWIGDVKICELFNTGRKMWHRIPSRAGRAKDIFQDRNNVLRNEVIFVGKKKKEIVEVQRTLKFLEYMLRKEGL